MRASAARLRRVGGARAELRRDACGGGAIASGEALLGDGGDGGADGAELGRHAERVRYARSSPGRSPSRSASCAPQERPRGARTAPGLGRRVGAGPGSSRAATQASAAAASPSWWKYAAGVLNSRRGRSSVMSGTLRVTVAQVRAVRHVERGEIGGGVEATRVDRGAKARTLESRRERPRVGTERRGRADERRERRQRPVVADPELHFRESGDERRDDRLEVADRELMERQPLAVEAAGAEVGEALAGRSRASRATRCPPSREGRGRRGSRPRTRAWRGGGSARRRPPGGRRGLARTPSFSRVKSAAASSASGTSSTPSTWRSGWAAAAPMVSAVPTPRARSRSGAGWRRSGTCASRCSRKRPAVPPSEYLPLTRRRFRPWASAVTMTVAVGPSR